MAVNCGAGTCKKDEGFHYHCECDPGNVNMLNRTKYPCVDHNCKPAGPDRMRFIRFALPCLAGLTDHMSLCMQVSWACIAPR